ncbi:MAG TPA: glycosyltransferase [Opitutaceae bacterium]|jgi:glycosyltransferase involved in cell wall biosynthesis|nr:glycosyltransferase [Opitutaceae bacterium]
MLSVLIPAHNPNAARLRRTLAGLRDQTLPADRWETVLVDNASAPALDLASLAGDAPGNLRIVREPELGLTAARRRGFTEAEGSIFVLVDDDNVLAPDYLEQVLALFSAHPRVGALGGKSAPEFAVEPPAWTHEFFPLLALRDPGDRPLISSGLRPSDTTRNVYPASAPIGAGMALRRSATTAWLDAVADDPRRAALDRRGAALVSGGDNDLVLTLMTAGWEVAYFPQLALTHLIPAARLEAGYLMRLNRAMQTSWMHVLTLHEANPWPPLTPFGAALRKTKAWFTQHPWSSPAARVRYAGTCGHFDGRVPARAV